MEQRYFTPQGSTEILRDFKHSNKSRDYRFRPDRWNTDTNNHDAIKLGLELEYNYYDGEFEGFDSNAYEINALLAPFNRSDNEIGNTVFVKHDGSLRDGVEIVFHPLSLQYYLDNEEHFINLLAHDALHISDDCGLHIHSSKWYDFDRDSKELALSNMRVMAPFIDFISRRHNQFKLERYANLNFLYVTVGRGAVYDAHADHDNALSTLIRDNKYISLKSINNKRSLSRAMAHIEESRYNGYITTEYTNELRFFAGTKQWETIKFNLGFTYFLFNAVREGVTFTNISDFLAYAVTHSASIKKYEFFASALDKKINDFITTVKISRELAKRESLLYISEIADIFAYPVLPGKVQEGDFAVSKKSKSVNSYIQSVTRVEEDHVTTVNNQGSSLNVNKVRKNKMLFFRPLYLGKSTAKLAGAYKSSVDFEKARNKLEDKLKPTLNDKIKSTNNNKRARPVGGPVLTNERSDFDYPNYSQLSSQALNASNGTPTYPCGLPMGLGYTTISTGAHIGIRMRNQTVTTIQRIDHFRMSRVVDQVLSSMDMCIDSNERGYRNRISSDELTTVMLPRLTTTLSEVVLDLSNERHNVLTLGGAECNRELEQGLLGLISRVYGSMLNTPAHLSCWALEGLSFALVYEDSIPTLTGTSNADIREHLRLEATRTNSWDGTPQAFTRSLHNLLRLWVTVRNNNINEEVNSDVRRRASLI